MVKIALAGGSGDVASEIIEALAATKKHDIVILSRKVSLP
jgi:saccharopine dehydrogenase-like NADP-dependent oxidoreductase